MFVSSQLSEIMNFLNEDQIQISLIENSFDLLQIYTQDILTITLALSELLTEEIINSLKEAQVKKALLNIGKKEINKMLPAGIVEYGFEYLEFSTLKELAAFIETLCEHLVNDDENSELIMLQRQDEVFKPNQIWIKFLSSIPGVSQIKAEAISKVYSNFTELVLGYGNVPEDQRGNMLKDIPTGSVTVGKVISNKIFMYINASDPKLTL